MKLHHRLLIALVLGIVCGTLLHERPDIPWLVSLNTHVLQPIGQIFLRLIFMIVVPMVFSALVLGVCELGRRHGLGRVAGKTLLFTLMMSSLSVLIGLTLVNTLRPGRGFEIDTALVSEQSTAVRAIESAAASSKPLSQIIVDLVPRNPIDSAAKALDGEMLPFMVFSLMFGFGLSLITRRSEGSGALVAMLEQVFAVCMNIVDVAMRLAPVAVFAIIFNTAFRFGYGVFGALFFYVVTVVVGLLIQQFVVYSVLLRTVAGRSPVQFFTACREVYLYAFSTASSNATLPLALDTADEKLRLPPNIARFVLTVGSTANQNGTALFEGITILFLAQVYDVDLTTIQQLQVMVMSIVAGIGTAGVPGGSLPLIMIVVQSVGIPVEGMGLILGVDRFLDMCRTTVNVSGDLVIAALVSGRQRTVGSRQTVADSKLKAEG
ncbi:MAG TPA: dicarboxylate/amino acid:cation symporter [Vicinamibacterales bacterium]